MSTSVTITFLATGDMASALRQASKAEKEALNANVSDACDISAGPSCGCSTQIVTAFKAMGKDTEPSSMAGWDEVIEAEADQLW